VRELVEQCEDLACLGRGVVNVDDREFIVGQAEPSKGGASELVFEDIDSGVGEALPPLLKRYLNIWPLGLLVDADTK
jgi:hypothetical protein